MNQSNQNARRERPPRARRGNVDLLRNPSLLDNIDGLLEQSARDAAAEEAEVAAKRAEEKLVADSLKDGRAYLQPIKEEIKRSRKPRMRTLEYYLCDACDKPILNPQDGFVVQGNIYTADPGCRGGLIGNNIPNAEAVNPEDIKSSVFCRSCFLEAIGISQRANKAQAEANLNDMWIRQQKRQSEDDVPF